MESLSHLLELPIQDIVTGESAADQENAVTELVRLAKLQEKRKREKRPCLQSHRYFHGGAGDGNRISVYTVSPCSFSRIR